MICAPTSRAQSISRFSNGWTRISQPVLSAQCAASASTMPTRSSNAKSGPLPVLIATPITNRSTSRQARRMMST